ncbi:TRAP-type C4-dicarboxylate transport system, substrate-binding protein [Marinomonas polaris DSM 16579]|uniref:TRAP-type C4-dicarboxylate transport system, substrate-binding protein n=1 Tax=Marinomonas polaris DSM 16579 TaxID=1122206 RepID=A0A1M5AB11_9GAMM|nr:TRAP transporter substrate-binding protein [Marinomonas polaris]SHF27491.1 TRAP-type C4-dicarboxylate transport system, substrate-binding protein [Marinomonas polaris DSM 16579]
MKNKLIISTLCLSSLWTTLAFSQTYTLRLAHFWPANSSVGNVIQDWADSIENDSNKQLKIEIYPSQTLAKAAQSYASTVNGIADITVTAQGYMAGRFPLTQVVELPGLITTAENSSCAIQKLYDNKLISSEYTDTHPLFLFVHGPGHLHTSEKQILEPSDLEGMRIRRATTVVADLLSSMNANPVGMPAPDTYQSAQRGVIQGVAFPWQAMKDFRLNELLTHHTEIGLYTLSFITTMNKRAYNNLPDNLKKIMDKHSGEHWSRVMGKALDNLDAAGRKEALEAGHTIEIISNVNTNPVWGPITKKVIASYISDMKNQSKKAENIYQKALEYSAECSTNIES